MGGKLGNLWVSIIYEVEYIEIVIGVVIVFFWDLIFDFDIDFLMVDVVVDVVVLLEFNIFVFRMLLLLGLRLDFLFFFMVVLVWVVNVRFGIFVLVMDCWFILGNRLFIVGFVRRI